ncbi:aspartic proteinase CDR1 [Cinnamomum micranthum f. kanehirae]|uniref:Aspartic proteinase CDR1 n=1 Tax=Cinnamomum micranthum f. kanehirae TaxID=337451 RepID=A0A443NRJ0_9MAGN|nr:aspartic proteinase CDR1 [Cinnamomum micranthum f. kanehirae]
MAASVPFHPIPIFLLLMVLPNSLNAADFSIHLIHRDTPKSPFYNSSESLSDCVLRAIRRWNSRMDCILSSTSAATLTDVSSIVFPNSGSYLMTLSLGTPLVKFLTIADTVSDLIWTQSSPCESCFFEQDTPLFDPSKSSTYKRATLQVQHLLGTS